MPVGGDTDLYASNIHKAHALSDGGEERANPPSGTTKKRHQQWGLWYHKSQDSNFGVELKAKLSNFNPMCVIEFGRASHALIEYPHTQQVCIPN